MEKVRVGLIGIGNWAVDVHIANLQLIETLDITALCSRSEENRRRGLEAVGREVQCFASDEAIIGCDEVDAVIISTPNNTHAPLSIAALEAGKHVYCEKPMAIGTAEARRVAAAAEASGRVYMTGYELRYADVSRVIRQLIADGSIGRPRVLITGTSRPFAFRSGWRSDPEISGGVFAEMTSHYTDLIGSLVGGRPRFVSAMTSLQSDPRRSQDTTVSIEFEGGVVGSVRMILAAVGARSKLVPIEVIGETGHIIAELTGGLVELYKAPDEEPTDFSPQRPEPWVVHGFPGSREILEAFAASILRGEGNLCGPDAGLMTARVSEAGALSAARHETVAIE